MWSGRTEHLWDEQELFAKYQKEEHSGQREVGVGGHPRPKEIGEAGEAVRRA